MKKHSKKLVAAVTLAVSLMAAPSVFALNAAGDATGSGNKPVSLVGYEFLQDGANADKLVLHFDKEMPASSSLNEIVASMFKVMTTDELTTYTFTGAGQFDRLSTADTGGSYASGTSAINKGTKVTLTFKDGNGNGIDLGADSYDVYINGMLMDGNGITLGNYMDGEDIKFRFQVPDSGVYSGDPYATYVWGKTDNPDVNGKYLYASQESQVAVIFDRPFQNDSTKLSTFKTNLSPSWTTGTGGESWAVASNDRDATYGNTVFFYSMTRPGYTSAIYNRATSTDYGLDLPAASYYYDSNGTQATAYGGMGSALDFRTVASDYAGWEMNNDTAANGDNTNIEVTHDTVNDKLVVHFHETWVNPNPAKYEIWYIDTANGKNQYSGIGQWTKATTLTNPEGEGHEGHGITYEIAGVADDKDYFVRVRPQNSDDPIAKSGFSKANATAD